MTTKRTLLALCSVIAIVILGIMFSPTPTTPLEREQHELATSHGTPRSPHWSKVRHEYMQEHPDGCAACGSKVDPQIHHVIPFHIDPSKELDKDNLIWLCGPKASNHHLHIGHNGNYQKWNPNVREDAANALQNTRQSP